MVTITMDEAHVFAQALIANGWLNEDPNCVDTLHRQLLAITTPPAGYELAPSAATLVMQLAGQAVGVNASWSFAKCYRAMLDAQPTNLPVHPLGQPGKPEFAALVDLSGPSVRRHLEENL